MAEIRLSDRLVFPDSREDLGSSGRGWWERGNSLDISSASFLSSHLSSGL